MCPACVSTLALIATGAGSAGGLAALVVTKLQAKSGVKDLDQKARSGADKKESPQ